jgi:hypothetical protein
MSVPKWTEDRTEALVAYVGDESPVSQETVAGAAEELETSTRSVSSKLRKMGYEVELASARAHSKFTEKQEATLRAFVEENSGEYTYAEIAEAFEGGNFSPKSIQGKILSMELTDHVKPAPKKEAVRKFNEEEEATILDMIAKNAFVEDIAEALNRTVNQIRGKALSMLRAGQIEAIPTQKVTKGSTRKDPLTELGDVSELTVSEIAEKIEKTERGVRTMLTRRGINCADYKGKDRAEKAAAA